MEPLNYEPVKSTCIYLFGAILRVASSSSWYVYTTERENTVLKNPQVCSFLHLLGPLWLKLVEATALMLGSLRVQTVWWSPEWWAMANSRRWNFTGSTAGRQVDAISARLLVSLHSHPMSRF